MNKKMRARKRRQARRVALTLVLMLTVALVSIGGTIAWLTDKTDAVENTFTVGNIDIDLYEHLRNEDGTLKTGTEEANITREGIDDYKIIPGTDLAKDPTAVVKAGSEKCYLFVKVEATGWTNSKVSYSINTSVWTALDATNNPGVYYKVVETNATQDQSFNILTDNEVTVSDDLTKEEVDAITSGWTLTFTAYACQFENRTAAEAWTAVQA